MIKRLKNALKVIGFKTICITATILVGGYDVLKALFTKPLTVPRRIFELFAGTLGILVVMSGINKNTLSEFMEELDRRIERYKKK